MPVPKYDLTFRRAEHPINARTTKFGGLPTWLAETCWPLSRATRKPMLFVCQIALDQIEMGNGMVYVFISEDPGGDLQTWLVDGGENAIIVQPGLVSAPHLPLAVGPYVFTMEGQRLREPVPCEFEVDLTPGADPDMVDLTTLENWTADERQRYRAALLGTKLCGTPGLLQHEEPIGAGWTLLAQIDSVRVPFEINFGGCGVGYVFLSPSGTAGKFFWQDI